MALVITALVIGGPYLYYRYSYTFAKRLRPVDEVKGVYRSGCMTADGLAHAIKTLKIRTVFNLMEEYPDPILSTGYFDTTDVREAEVCERLGARMISLTVDTLAPIRARNNERPAAIAAFLDLMDRPETYPVLIHCKAGLHRTGVLVAVYRMGYNGWPRQDAMGELKANGFGDFAANASNDYIEQYILSYQRQSDRVSRAP